ncbi:MAG: bifunctional 5,10-methylene-tetrahydrofolate dehydrogenase/5,10-methylene-tetrahydrofolate cyclohydrolase [Bacteroidales bacterium]|nr:bifunctional 5,10-methylene-tetrahydrofolate dehydrogenase/5,10-methylene-tetrahydrofolate cyclohydrolase [Bacteroidales bacterium]
MILIDGKETAGQIKLEIAREVEDIIARGGKRPHLAAVLVGNDPASETYVSFKVKDCEQVGFESTLVRFEEDTPEAELLARVAGLNRDAEIDGFIVQLPLPSHISEAKVIESIDPSKDVDGFHPVNVGRMLIGLPCFESATPAGIIELIKRYNIPTSGKHCVVIGRSNIVGKPIAALLAKKRDLGNATVTVCHSRTKDIREMTLQADIIIAAMGQPGFLTEDMVPQDAVVIDVGTTRVKSDKTKSGFKLMGDVDFDAVATKCSYITPVPGGVGPMTRVSLLLNTLKAAKKEIYP